LSKSTLALTVVAAMLAATVGAAATWALSDSPDAGDPSSTSLDPASVVQTEYPAQSGVAEEPQLDGPRDVHPLPGAIARVAGPFDDRFGFERLELGADSVTGRVRITTDVSEVLELQVVAGLYDMGGRYLGQARFVHHHGTDEAHEDRPEPFLDFEVTVPRRFQDQARAAAVGVPFLVNE
jgi:hypothetical protein